MEREPLDFLPIWAFFLVTSFVVQVALEVGYRCGRRQRARQDMENEAPVGAMVAATLGLVAFLLAFTFGMAANRFESRRQIVLEEANAIGTAYLRAGMLDESQRLEVRSLLKEYVDARLTAADTGNVKDAVVKSDRIHGFLWQRAEASGKANPHSVVNGLFIQSINDVIDLHSKRVLIAVQSRIPVSIWLGLGLTTVLALVGMGYQEGLSGKRSPVSFFLVLAFSGVLLLIADLDRPREGMLRVSQQALVDLRSGVMAAP